MNAEFTTFVCPRCNTEIQASQDMVGKKTECPACGQHLVIPEASDDGVIRYSAGADDPDRQQAMKSRTLRIDLGDF